MTMRDAVKADGPEITMLVNELIKVSEHQQELIAQLSGKVEPITREGADKHADGPVPMLSRHTQFGNKLQQAIDVFNSNSNTVDRLLNRIEL